MDVRIVLIIAVCLVVAILMICITCCILYRMKLKAREKDRETFQHLAKEKTSKYDTVRMGPYVASTTPEDSADNHPSSEDTTEKAAPDANDLSNKVLSVAAPVLQFLKWLKDHSVK